MNSGSKKKTKFKAIIWPIAYFILILNVCASFLMVFHSYYYRSIFVSGSSMEPTLNGNVAERVDYGVIDDHDYALKNVKRFQIITTYYPFADSHDYVSPFVKGGTNEINTKDASYKIKRIYAFPGETFKFDIDEQKATEALAVGDNYSEEAQSLARQAIKFYILDTKNNEFIEQELNFKRKIKLETIHNYKNYVHTLGEEEYWVMGDNYAASSDCFSKKAPVYYENLVGVLIAIEGTCKIQGNVSDDEGTKVSYKCTQRKWHLPTYY